MDRQNQSFGFSNLKALEQTLAKLGRPGGAGAQGSAIGASATTRSASPAVQRVAPTQHPVGVSPSGSNNDGATRAPSSGAPSGSRSPGQVAAGTMNDVSQVIPGADPTGLGGLENVGPGTTPGGAMGSGGIFNSEGRQVFGADAGALMEPYAQEEGWSVEGGNRAMFGDDFSMAEAVWQLFSSGAAGMDVTNKEAFVREYIGQATTPGGTFYTEGQIREAMFNGPADSTFNLTMARLGPDQQVNYTVSTYVNALNSTVPAPMLAARKAQMEQWGREYLAMQHTQQGGTGMSFTQWLRATGKM